MWITKKAHWLIGKFLEGGFNYVAGIQPESNRGLTSWYVNGRLVGKLSDDTSYFPFAMPEDWMKELYELGFPLETTLIW